MKIQVLEAEQKGVPLYIGALRAEELLKGAQVDTWSPGNPQGYQRGLVSKRIGEVAWYLIDGEGIMPTTVLLSVRTHIEPDSGVLEIPDGEPLWVIDGQHRVAGLRGAIDRGQQSLNDYLIPVTILANPDRFDEMRLFYIVNSRAKSVPTDIADRLLQRALQERGELWIREKEAPQEKKAEKAYHQARATGIVDYLRDKCPVWRDMVELPGETKPNRYAVRQHTLVTSLLEGVFKDSSLTRWEDTALGELLDRYWQALSEVFPEAFQEPGEYSIRRMPGIYALHMIFPDVFERCRETMGPVADKYSKERMTAILKEMGLESEFWHTDPERGDPRTLGTGMKSIRLLAAYLRGSLPPLALAGM